MINNIGGDIATKSEQYWWRECIIISGFDIGKKGNPSHHSIFAITNDKVRKDEKGSPEEILIQLHQKFLDGWEYIKQIDYIEACIDYFSIQKMYIDNTRGEFEERGLPRQCVPITLSAHTGRIAKGKVEMATNFAKLVEQKRIELIDDNRFIAQILCVTNTLQAPNTPLGHGDAFISVMLAIAAYQDFYAKDKKRRFAYLGDIQEALTQRESPTSKTKQEDGCRICGKLEFENLPNNRRKCKNCFTIW